VAFWHDLKTVFHLANAVTALRVRVEEMELEWLDKRDALDRLARRLNMRAMRSPPDLADEPVATAPPSDAPSSKTELRHLARARGML
jgi:hypothetical protein